MRMLLFAALLGAAPSAPADAADTPFREYIEAYFAMYPGRATEAGRHDFDRRLEDFSPERLRAWVDTNRRIADRLRAALASRRLSEDDALDAELLLAQARGEVDALATRRRPERDPLFWTSVAGNATVFLLVREDRPRSERLEAAAARAALLPRLCRQAQAALSASKEESVSPELARIAADQARSSARFYREGFLRAVGGSAPAKARVRAAAAARALEDLAGFLERLAQRARGSPRLGAAYAAALEIATGEEDPAALKARALEDLAKKRAEAAAYGRSVWKEVLPGETPPADDARLLTRLFDRVAADRAKTTEEFVEDYRRQVRDLDAFLHARDVVTLPDPLTLTVDRSPSFFVGQAVGGVYPAGPYAPHANTLWFLPTPPDSATAEEREGFFRDFNHHFNVMITPHEILPGHYLQLKRAALGPRKVRALFPDGVYVEGWGTFCERLLLDLGWGGPLDRLAHLKKQLENIARAIVDVSVHTGGMSRDEVIRFVREEALQDRQFASNMWTRAITTPTQITTYYLGYAQVRALYDEARAKSGEKFSLRAFMDGMLSMGPVPVSRYRARILGSWGQRCSLAFIQKISLRSKERKCSVDPPSGS